MCLYSQFYEFVKSRQLNRYRKKGHRQVELCEIPSSKSITSINLFSSGQALWQRDGIINILPFPYQIYPIYPNHSKSGGTLNEKQL